VVFDIIWVNIFLGDDPAPGGDTGQMHGFRVPGNKGMPPAKLFSSQPQPVGAGLGKPAKGRHLVRCQLQAFLYEGHPVFIGATTAALGVQEVTRHVCVIDTAGFPVFQFLQTAQATAITQCFPLLMGQVRQAFGFPERVLIIRHLTSMAGRWVKPGEQDKPTCHMKPAPHIQTKRK
jgi:hypothetical protein